MTDTKNLSLFIDDETTNHLRDRLPQPYTKKDRRDFIERQLKNQTSFSFAIDLEGSLIGVIGLTQQMQK